MWINICHKHAHSQFSVIIHSKWQKNGKSNTENMEHSKSMQMEQA
jgi:hypothetical protein